MRIERALRGDLECIIVDESTPDRDDRVTCLLCHGFGAPGTDLVSLADEIVRQSAALRDRVRFIFPAAPIDMTEMGAPGGRAWWPLDLMRLQMAQENGIRDLRSERPERLPESRRKLIAAIEEDAEITGIDWSRTVIGGFSQGAMLAMDVALSIEPLPQGVIVWSGSLLAEDDWRLKVAAKQGMRVFQSHGTEDVVLPFAGAEWLREMLESAGVDVEFLSFRGGHSIPYAAIQGIVEMLEG